ncbi:hypothetical protein [Marinomonas sp. THO17]|uniref:hypothetical protein n=1 Tax=Marinomonas sp. THO17 TaxID=3149048 RepID=UPI00336BCFDF
MLSKWNKSTAEKVLMGRELAVVQGAIDTLEQGRNFLSDLTDEMYQGTAKPYVDSSIGEHFRHLLDMYQVLLVMGTGGLDKNLIDYNQRRRGHLVESCRYQAILETEQLIDRLEKLELNDIKQSVQVLSEVSVCGCQSAAMSSTLERELTFVSLHANHHFAMTKVVVNLLGGQTQYDFGYAAATLSYMRKA